MTTQTVGAVTLPAQKYNLTSLGLIETASALSVLANGNGEVEQISQRLFKLNQELTNSAHVLDASDFVMPKEIVSFEVGNIREAEKGMEKVADRQEMIDLLEAHLTAAQNYIRMIYTGIIRRLENDQSIILTALINHLKATGNDFLRFNGTGKVGILPGKERVEVRDLDCLTTAEKEYFIDAGLIRVKFEADKNAIKLYGEMPLMVGENADIPWAEIKTGPDKPYWSLRDEKTQRDIRLKAEV